MSRKLSRVLSSDDLALIRHRSTMYDQRALYCMRDKVFAPLHKSGFASYRRHGEVGAVCRHLSKWRYKSAYTPSLGLIPCLTHALSTSYPIKNSPYNCARG